MLCKRRKDLKAAAFAVLAGVGDRSKEWVEWTGLAFHVRRRLTEQEQMTVGPAIDCRGTEDFKWRLEETMTVVPGCMVGTLIQMAEKENGSR